jgi:hypothetical protein
MSRSRHEVHQAVSMVSALFQVQMDRCDQHSHQTLHYSVKLSVSVLIKSVPILIESIPIFIGCIQILIGSIPVLNKNILTFYTTCTSMHEKRPSIFLSWTPFIINYHVLAGECEHSGLQLIGAIFYLNFLVFVYSPWKFWHDLWH